MVLELHIWGPAFSLPSIDSKCLAATAYLKRAVPFHEWVLIPISDPTISPKGELPALKDGDTWVTGFSNIVDHIRQCSGGDWDLDASSSPDEKADRIAFSSFIESQGQPLVDLSLYVSSLTYTSCTRSAFSQILQWPNSWVWPSRMRTAAKKRSEHLGLSSLDIDSADAKENQTLDSPSNQIPKSLLKKPKETVTRLLGQAQQNHRFRLDALASAFFAPLEDLLGRKSFLLSSNQLSALDCLAVGHLALALFPEVPHLWARESLKDKFPLLASYTERVSRACFGPPIDPLTHLGLALGEAPSDPRKKSYESKPLPWKAVEASSLTGMGLQVIGNFADSLPLLSQIRANNRLRYAATDPDISSTEKYHLQIQSKAQRDEFYSQIATICLGVSAFAGYLFYIGFWSIGSNGDDEGGQESDGDGPFGAAGELLGLGSIGSMSTVGQGLPISSREQEHSVWDEPVHGVEVEVASDGES